ncbi:hypothetical protein [Lentzea xinjiangensis]|uniref:hypothetical protein n=1 Tax=Lentzea xinjiangensis TaxID=402600 RepID=UPI000AEAC52C|nr:hypothetical protein [Lentzea xinjiangensis]
MKEGFSQAAYNAAYRQLADAFYNGDISQTAEAIVDELQDRQRQHGMSYLLRLAQSFDGRSDLVRAIVLAGLDGSAAAFGAVDPAVAAAAKELLRCEVQQAEA